MRELGAREFSLIQELVSAGATNIPPAAMEKDVHISDVLGLVADFRIAGAQVIFCGGTSLVKAHKILLRMSEDVDFKIEFREQVTRSQSRKLLSVARGELSDIFERAGFVIDRKLVRDEGKYFSFDLKYKASFEKIAALRDVVKVEFTVSQTASEPQVLPIKTLISEYVEDDHISASIATVQVVDTVSEKVLSFLRRNRPNAPVMPYDPRIVRHLFDVHAISTTGNLGHSLEAAFWNAVAEDRRRYQHKDASFANDPIAEMKEALESLDVKKYEKDFDTFSRSLIAGQPPSFQQCIGSFIEVANRLVYSTAPS